MNDVVEIILEAFLSLIVLFFLTKIMGSKQITQLTLFDYIIGISIGSIAAEMATNQDTPFYLYLISMVIYALSAYLISILVLKSSKFRTFVNGKPKIIIFKGSVVYQELKKAKLSYTDLETKARMNNIFDLSTVDYALLETNGTVNFLQNFQSLPVNNKSLKISGMSELLVKVYEDNNYITKNLKSINRTKEWIEQEMEKEQISFTNVAIIYVDSNNKLSVIRKSTLSQEKLNRTNQ